MLGGNCLGGIVGGAIVLLPCVCVCVCVGVCVCMCARARVCVCESVCLPVRIATLIPSSDKFSDS